MKRIFNIIASVIVPIVLYSQELTLEDVTSIADNFFVSSKYIEASSSRIQYQIVPIKRKTTTYIYAVHNPNGGLLFISNEKKYKSILGYSEYGDLKHAEKNFPTALLLLFEHHINMIDSLRLYGAEVFYNHKRKLPAKDLRTTNIYTDSNMLLRRNGDVNIWGQSHNNSNPPYNCNKTYNLFCPTTFNADTICNRTFVGCSAVAVGQLMWYWQWPDYASIPSSIDWLGITSGPYHIQYYDWDNMPHQILNTTDQYTVNMISGLLRDCGYLENMHYWLSGSYAGIESINSALQSLLYHTNIVHEYAWTDIASIIQSDIFNSRPVICQAWKNDGSNEDGGHSFVIDGYNSNSDYYHINFGWMGIDDGWYDLGFNGYDGNRTFITEIYPDCSMRSNNVIVTGDTINEGEVRTFFSTNNISISSSSQHFEVNNGGHLIAQAGHSITLNPGFYAKLGSSIKLSIRDFCETREDLNKIKDGSCQTQGHTFQQLKYSNQQECSISPNPVHDILTINSTDELEKITIYDLSGRCILQTKQTQININDLPNGMYLLEASTVSGHHQLRKFIKQ